MSFVYHCWQVSYIIQNTFEIKEIIQFSFQSCKVYIYLHLVYLTTFICICTTEQVFTYHNKTGPVVNTIIIITNTQETPQGSWRSPEEYRQVPVQFKLNIQVIPCEECHKDIPTHFDMFNLTIFV